MVNISQVFARGRESYPQPECCVGVECVARNLGNVTLRTWAEAICRCGAHRITESKHRRTVYRIGNPNHEWEGFIR